MTQTSYTILMMLTATPAWLGQSRKERATFRTTVIQPVLERYANHVQVRFYDAEAFAARCSDFAIFTTEDLQTYTFLIEALRDTALFTVPYFVVNEVLIGLENGYQAFEEASSVQRQSS
ncbi:MAG TPA: darcynin family protein [Ktedonobacteraceae bacterium]|nr:darcynin family protein [Ktedonobacteraceae bacterium]